MVKVSVIVPVYKVEKTLRKCVNSILDQSLSNIEIILINDGSPDKCPKICEELKSCDNRIKVIHKKNGGLASARNEGIKIATGEYIIFIDSDDYINEDTLLKLYEKAKKNKLDVVVCGCRIEYINENYYIDKIPNETIALTQSEIGKCVFNLNVLGIFNLSWNKLVKTSLIKENNLLFPEFATTGQDLFFNVSLFKIIESAGTIKNPLYHYIKNDSETLVLKYHKNMHKIAKARIDVLNELFTFFKLTDKESKQWLLNAYCNNIHNCILNLFRKDCPLSDIEKINFLKDYILSDKYFCEILKKYDPKNKYDLLFKKIVGIKNPVMIVYLYTLLFRVKVKYGKHYLSFRKKQFKG